MASVALYYIIFVTFMMKVEAERRKEAFIWGCSLVLLLFMIVIRPYLSPDGKVTMLDIGQGDAIVVELPYRESVILIDAGAKLSFDTDKPSEGVYKQIIRPYLLSQGINEIDAIFISHGDLDHMGSLPFIAEDLPVHHVIVSPYYTFRRSVFDTITDAGAEIVRAGSGDALTVGDQVFKVLSPNTDHGTPNENSLVLYAEFGGKTWLFTGDVDDGIEKT